MADEQQAPPEDFSIPSVPGLSMQPSASTMPQQTPRIPQPVAVPNKPRPPVNQQGQEGMGGGQGGRGGPHGGPPLGPVCSLTPLSSFLFFFFFLFSSLLYLIININSPTEDLNKDGPCLTTKWCPHSHKARPRANSTREEEGDTEEVQSYSSFLFYFFFILFYYFIIFISRFFSHFLILK